MGNSVVEFGGKYLLWSTVVDAPVTYLMTRSELTAYLLESEGYEAGVGELERRMERVSKQGASALTASKESLLAHNRAGPDGTCLSTESEMVAAYSATEGPDDGREVLSLDAPMELVHRWDHYPLVAPVVEVLSRTGDLVLANVKVPEIDEPVVVLFDRNDGSIKTVNFKKGFVIRNSPAAS